MNWLLKPLKKPKATRISLSINSYSTELQTSPSEASDSKYELMKNINIIKNLLSLLEKP